MGFYIASEKIVYDNNKYYPIIVFEDVKLVQKGILSIINRWFYEEVKKEKELSMSDIACMPIMVVSINTLYLQDKFLQKKGLTNVIDSFVAENAKQDSKTGEYRISPLADFDEYLRNNPYNKRGDMMRWYRNLLSGLEEDASFSKGRSK